MHEGSEKSGPFCVKVFSDGFIGDLQMIWNSRFLVLGSALAMAACSTVQNDEQVLVAKTVLTDTNGRTVGSAEILQADSGLTLKAQVSGLSPGAHGIHLHTTGKCEAPSFTTAGGHLNPSTQQHGTMNPAGPHLGDLPNIDVSADGSGSVNAPISGVPADVRNAIYDADGTALVVHAGPDDYKTDPSGNSGGRIACGVLTSSAG